MTDFDWRIVVLAFILFASGAGVCFSVLEACGLIVGLQ